VFHNRFSVGKKHRLC